MSFFVQIFTNAFKLLLNDRTTYQILFRSIYVNGMATLISASFAIPFALLMDAIDGKFKDIAVTTLQTLMGIPPVVVGLVVYLFLSRNGPLANIDLLFSRTAMIIAQVLIAFPIIFTVSYSHFSKVDDRIRLIAKTLGANDVQVTLKVFRESIHGVITATMTAFGRIVGEVGAVMLVGGNIQGRTRIMTTSIVLYTNRGEFERASALGIILLIVAFIINFLANYFSKLFMRRLES